MKLKLNIAFITLALAMTMVTGSSFALAGYGYNVDVFVDGRQVAFPDQKPFVDNSVGRTYVPVRFVSEALGCNVNWDNATETASIGKAGTWVDIKIGSKTPAITNMDSGSQTTVAIDAPAMLINGRTMVPLRFVSEALKANVSWKSPEQSGTGKGRVDVNQKQDNETNRNDVPPGSGEVIYPTAVFSGTDQTKPTPSDIPWVK